MNSEKEYWFDDRRGVNLVVYLMCAICALLLGLDWFRHDDHAHFKFENWFGFFGWFGFVACVSFVVAARVMRVLLRREDGYYDRSD